MNFLQDLHAFRNAKAEVSTPAASSKPINTSNSKDGPPEDFREKNLPKISNWAMFVGRRKAMIQLDQAIQFVTFLSPKGWGSPTTFERVT